MKLDARLLALLILASPLGLAQHARAQDFEWRVQLRANTVAPSNVEATNHCFKTHGFRVEPESLPFMRLLGSSTFTVNPAGQHKVPVEFDTRNMKPGQYEALVVVRCLTCKSEKGCRQDHQNLRVFLTVTPAPPNWSAVHPELKISEPRSPAQRWAGITPERKPPQK